MEYIYVNDALLEITDDVYQFVHHGFLLKDYPSQQEGESLKGMQVLTLRFIEEKTLYGVPLQVINVEKLSDDWDNPTFSTAIFDKPNQKSMGNVNIDGIQKGYRVGEYCL